MSRYKAVALFLFAALFGGLAFSPAQAQEPPPENTPVPPVAISGFNPAQVMSGQSVTLTINGAHFQATTVAQISGIGALPTTWIGADTLQATLPDTLPAGQYQVIVSDPQGGNATASALLDVVEPTPTPTDTPTMTPTDTPTSTPTDTPTPTSTPTPTQTPTPPLSVLRTEPGVTISGQGGVLSVFGSNFTPQSMVRVIRVGLLETTYLNPNALTAVIPTTMLVGQYGIEVVDPLAGVGRSPNNLNVIAPTSTPAPTPEPREPTPRPPTPEPPTPLPGIPSLVVRNFSADPSPVAPGGRVTLRFEVFNQGNRPALGIAAAVDTSGKFVPANGQASAVVPDLRPGGVFTVSLVVVVAMDAPPGPTSLPLTLTYRDQAANVLTANASLSVTISEIEAGSSQVSISSVVISPSPVEPGKPATVSVFVMNSGNKIARQALLRVSGGENVLLAGPQGDSLPLGDIAPRSGVIAEMPVIISAVAKPGPQAQPVTISYIDADATQEVSSSVTVDVAKVAVTAPLILLEAYETSQETLQPGDRFTLDMTLKNVGNGAADGLTVTFGTVESAPPSDNPDNSGGNSATTASTTFAPVGAGGTVYIGALGASGEQAAISQDFVVNGTVASGIYALPITLRYQKPDGTAAQDALQATVIVIAPPRMQVRLPGPLPETVNAGEPLPVSVEIINMGDKRLNLTAAITTARNGEILEGGEIFVGALAQGEDTTISPLVMPLEEGPVEITITLHYINDLNQEESVAKTYTTQAMLPPPQPEDLPPDPEPTPDPADSGDDSLVGRFLRGFLGLGS